MSKYTSTQKLNAANSSSTAGNNNCFGESAEAATPLSLPAVLDLMPSCPGGAARIKQRRGNDEREKLFGVSIGRRRTRGGGEDGADGRAAARRRSGPRCPPREREKGSGLEI
uniref:Uncharacterized protein n=1 Tax=Oryza nivara TaxID=4536 RepID=A0A0E0GRD9_ORYNI